MAGRGLYRHPPQPIFARHLRIPSETISGSFTADAVIKKIQTFTDIPLSNAWTSNTQGSTDWNDVAYGNGYWVAVGASGTLRYTTDPTGTWTSNTQGSTTFNGVAFANGYWVAVGNSGTLYHASDPTGAWTSNAQGANAFQSVSFGNGFWVAVGNGGTLYYKGGSDPAGTWTSNTQGTTNMSRVEYGNGYWAASGNSGSILYRQTEPIGSWTTNTQGTTNYESVRYLNGYWVVTSESGGFRYRASDPTSTFTENATGAVQTMYDVTYAFGTWFIVGTLRAYSMVASGAPSGTWVENTSLFGSTSSYAIAWDGGRDIVVVGQTGTLIWYRNTALLANAVIVVPPKRDKRLIARGGWRPAPRAPPQLPKKSIFSADAGPATIESSFTADAILKREQSASYSADAILKKTITVGGGSATIVRESFATGTDTGVTTTHVVNVPSGTVSGDVLVCVIGWNGSPGTITKPTGWVDVANASGQANPKLNMYLKVSDGTEGADETWTTTGSIYSGAVMARYSGVDNTTPQDATAVATDGVAATTFDLTGITTVTDGAMVIAGTAANSSSLRITEDNILTEVTEVAVASQQKDTELDDGILASAGPTGLLNYDLNSSVAWAGVVMALRPATGVGGGPTLDAVITAVAPIHPNQQLTALGIWNPAKRAAPQRQRYAPPASALTTVPGSFTADAVLFKTITGSFTADAVVFKTISGSFTADAVIKRTIAGSLTADAVIKRTQSATFTADAIIKRPDQPGSFTADAVIKRTFLYGGVVAQDSFTESGSGLADLSTHTAELGGAWVEVALAATSGIDIDKTNDRAIAHDYNTGFYQVTNPYRLGPLVGDGFAEGVFAPTGTGDTWAGPVVRLLAANTDTFYVVYFDNGGTPAITLYRSTDGALVSLGTSSAGSGNYIRLVATGVSPTRLRVYRSTTSTFTGVPVIDVTDNTAANNAASEGYVGIRLTQDDEFNFFSTADDFLAVSGGAWRDGSGFTADAVISTAPRRLHRNLPAIGVWRPAKRNAPQRIRYTPPVSALTTVEGSFTTDAVVLRTQSATLTADAVVLRTQFASLTADAIIKKTIPGSFATDAVIKREQSGSFSADAVIKREISGSFLADAVVRRQIDGAFTADAVIRRTQTASFTGDAVLFRTQVGSVTADAVVFRTIAGSFTADAVVKQTRSFAVTADGVVHRVTSASLTTDAIVLRTESATFTADADISSRVLRPRTNITGNRVWRAAERIAPQHQRNGPFTLPATVQSGSFSADAVIKATLSFSFTADASIKTATSGASTVDAVILREQTGSFTADAFVIGPLLAGRHPQPARAVWMRPQQQRKLHPTNFIVEQSGSFTADAIVRRTQSGSFTANAIILRSQVGSLTADAVLAATINGSLATNAVVLRAIAGSFTADAVVLRSQAATFTADAVIKRGQVSSASADAVIFRSQTAAATADAVIFRSQAGSSTADAIVRRTQAASTSVDAVIFRAQTFTLAADSVLFKSQASSFVVDAVVFRSTTASFAADAVIRIERTGSISANAVIFRAVTASASADAVIFRTVTNGFAADAVIARTITSAFAVDAVVLRPQSGSLTADAVLYREQVGSFEADAYINVIGVYTFSADAIVLREEPGSFEADAVIGYVGRCVWVSPANHADMTGTPTLVFIMPPSSRDMHFNIHLDKVDTFDGSDLRIIESFRDPTGWEYWNGSSWQPIPQAGVSNAFSGNEARYTVQTPLASGTWYRRVRAGVI